nr:uncharacterized protein LOC111427633 [Onthophagus taurus]
MLNHRYVPLIIFFFVTKSSVTFPLTNSELTDANNTIAEDYIIIDQRQNGTDNVRVNIDGVIIALTPIEGLFGGGLEDLDFLDEFDITTKASVGGGITSTEKGDGTTKKKLKRRRNGMSQLMRTLFGHRRITSKDN